MTIKPADMGRIYYDACDAKGYKGNEGQLKLWRQMLGYADLGDLRTAMELYWQENSDFPMPAQLRHLVERARRERLEKSGGPSEMVEYECPQCHAPFSTVVDVGDMRPRLCLVFNEQKELRGCRVRLTELNRMSVAQKQKRA